MQYFSIIAERVAEVYAWIDNEIKTGIPNDHKCIGCGNCCDFNSFGHRLFITSPEMLYFRIKTGRQNILHMPDGICPYRIDGKCSVHENRFAGCRIFYCKANEDIQSQLSEESIKRFKNICEEFQMPYQYKDLASALNFMAKPSRL